MSALVGITLAAIIMIVLIYPFIKARKSAPRNVDPVERVASADTLRHLLYREPLTLRHEYEAGNISIEEYESQLNELRHEAAILMRQRAENRTRLLEAELALEKEVQRVRGLRSQGEVQGDDGDA